MKVIRSVLNTIKRKLCYNKIITLPNGSWGDKKGDIMPNEKERQLAGNQGNKERQLDGNQDNKELDKKDEPEKKFTQDDLNSFAAKIRAEEKVKSDKVQVELKKQQELAKMEEGDRLKAEKEDAEAKLKELQDKVTYNENKSQIIQNLSTNKLNSKLINVIMGDKTADDKIKILSEVLKEEVEKAVKEAIPAHKPKFGNNDSTKKTDKEYKYNFQRFKN